MHLDNTPYISLRCEMICNGCDCHHYSWCSLQLCRFIHMHASRFHWAPFTGSAVWTLRHKALCTRRPTRLELVAAGRSMCFAQVCMLIFAAHASKERGNVIVPSVYVCIYVCVTKCAMNINSPDQLFAWCYWQIPCYSHGIYIIIIGWVVQWQ